MSCHFVISPFSHLNVVVPVVMEVDDSVELGVHVDLDVLGVLEPLAEALPRVLLHLDVVKLPGREYRPY